MKTFSALRLAFARWVLPAVVVAGGGVSGCATRALQIDDTSCQEQVTKHIGLLPAEHPWFKYTTIFSSAQPAVFSKACAAGSIAVVDMANDVTTEGEHRYVTFSHENPMIWARMLLSRLEQLERVQKEGRQDLESLATVFYIMHYIQKNGVDPQKVIQVIMDIHDENVVILPGCSLTVDVTPEKQGQENLEGAAKADSPRAGITGLIEKLPLSYTLSCR